MSSIILKVIEVFFGVRLKEVKKEAGKGLQCGFNDDLLGSKLTCFVYYA